MNKADLRELYLQKRVSLSEIETASASGEIADRFFESVDLNGVSKLHIFVPIRKFTEIDTSLIYQDLWRDHPEIVTVAPRADLARSEIDGVAFDAATEWNENAWGIREPTIGETVAASEIDLVIVPMLCFDASGHRVGYGKGMYDRFLALCRPDCLKVGINYFAPLPEISDLAPTDIPLDMCVTPEQVFRFEMDVSHP